MTFFLNYQNIVSNVSPPAKPVMFSMSTSSNKSLLHVLRIDLEPFTLISFPIPISGLSCWKIYPMFFNGIPLRYAKVFP